MFTIKKKVRMKDCLSLSSKRKGNNKTLVVKLIFSIPHMIEIILEYIESNKL